MKRLLLCLLIQAMFTLSYGQCTITQDSTGLIVTTCRGTSSTLRYLGSEFLTFPIWQYGTLALGNTGRQISARICYNVYTNQVFSQLDDSTTTEVFPDEFTINGASFIKQSLDGSARHATTYYLLRYPGKTKLLESIKCKISPVSTPFDQFGSIAPYYAQYKKQSSYYVQKGDANLKLIDLTKRSLVGALHEQAEALNGFITQDKLTMHELINVLAYYDSLMATAPRSSIPLNDDLTFKEILHEYMQYPPQAWNQGIYSRIYMGFEIDTLGHLKNIVPLSPANAGYGFIETATKALQRVPALSASYAGFYALPIAFSYTNLSDKNHVQYAPRMLLSSEKTANRQLLDELEVPVTVNRPSLLDRSIQEVWGYYR